MDELCFPIVGAVEKYLNRKDIRRQLGVNKSVSAFKTCSKKTEQDFASSGDPWISTTNQVVYLLNKGVSVLIFAGEYDWIWYVPVVVIFDSQQLGRYPELAYFKIFWMGWSAILSLFVKSSVVCWRETSRYDTESREFNLVTVAKAGHMVRPSFTTLTY